MDANEPDFIVVGGGSAGCVLANRLSEDGRKRVVVLEAGGDGDSYFIRMPAFAAKLIGNPAYDWLYRTEPDPSAAGRQLVWSSGKMLGGGSGINGMVYIRGARHDYDGWAAMGCAGWGWTDVLPYFNKSEDFDGPMSENHGKGGPLSVEQLRIKHPLADVFVQACLETGLREVEDYSSGDVDGAFINYLTQASGERCSSARANLKAARGRDNLRLVTSAIAHSIIIEQGRAVGVRYRHQGTIRELRCRGEVIVAAGTIQSPALLMRSGIGPARELRHHGIQVIRDAPEVGRNLQEHASFPISYFVDVPTYNVMQKPWQLAGQLARYALTRRGMMTTAPVHAMAFLRSRPELAHPDIKLQFGPYCYDLEKRAMHERPGVSVFTNVSPPGSRGEIRLSSADPADAPVIDHRLFGDPADMAAIIRGLKGVEKIFAAPVLARHVTGRNIPAEKPQSDDEWADQVRSFAGVGYHPVGTCRMGGDEMSVVDPELRVRGIVGLRVIDASIMPRMPAANTNAPSIMIGEKGADLVVHSMTSG